MFVRVFTVLPNIHHYGILCQEWIRGFILHGLIGFTMVILTNRWHGTIWFGFGVELGSEIASVAATVENHQSRNLSGEFGFALLDEKLTKLVCELSECVSEENVTFVSVGSWKLSEWFPKTRSQMSLRNLSPKLSPTCPASSSRCGWLNG